VQKAEQEKGMKVDLLLLCGDFQASALEVIPMLKI
jgi:hypothetical protein